MCVETEQYHKSLMKVSIFIANLLGETLLNLVTHRIFVAFQRGGKILPRGRNLHDLTVNSVFLRPRFANISEA
jgi:hypothetical protein